MKRTITFCLIALWVVAAAAGAQTYNADDVAALKNTLLTANNPGLLDKVWDEAYAGGAAKPEAGDAGDAKWDIGTNNWLKGVIYEDSYWTDGDNGKVLNGIVWVGKGLEEDLVIRDFPHLTRLLLYTNKLTSLTVTNLPLLNSLECYGASDGRNTLTSLNISGTPGLTALYCAVNRLTRLDVSQLTKLTSLDCHTNQLTTLDVSQLTKLTSLDCSTNQLTTLDVSRLTELTRLDCGDNQLTRLDVSRLTKLTVLYCYDNQLTRLDVSGLTGLTDLYCQNNMIPFKQLPQLVGAGLQIFTYSPQKLLNYTVYAGSRPDLSDFLISKGTTRYKAEGMADFVELTTAIEPPVLELGDTWEVEFKNDYFSGFDNNTLKVTFSGVEAPPVPSLYHTVALTVAPGIWCDYAAGELTVEEGGHLYAQFRVEDPSLTAADILFLVDGVETAFKASVDGRGGSYILNPVKSDRTVLIAQRQYNVNIPEVDGAVISPAPGTHKVAYGEPFRFTIDLKDSNPLRASNSIKVFANGIELTPNETGQTQSLQFTIDAVNGPVTITIEGLDPIANISLTTTLFNIYVSDGILVAESPSAIQLSVYTPTGQLYTVRRIPAGTTRLALPAGMYIVRMGDVIRKVVVN